MTSIFLRMVRKAAIFVYIDDVVHATTLAIENNEVTQKVYNVGSGEATTVLEVAETLKELYDSSIAITVTGNYRLGDIRHNYADNSRIENELGFKPKFNFKKGVTEFAKWVKTEAIEEDRYAKSIEEMKKKGLFK